MNTKSCPGAKQSKAGDQAIHPSYKRKANQGTGSRQHHRTTKEALDWATFCTHICKLKGASLRTSGLLQTCCISYWLTVDRSRSATKAAQPYCLICWITRGHGMWWNPWTRKGRALPHKDSSNCSWVALPALVITPRTEPKRKAEWTVEAIFLRWVNSKWAHIDPPKIIKYYFL